MLSELSMHRQNANPRFLAPVLRGLLISVTLATSHDALADDEDPEDLPVNDVEQIVVTGSRIEQRVSDAPVGVEIISRDEIEAAGAENVADMLEEHPSLDVFRSFNGTNIRIQGLDSKYILILVNGERTAGRIAGNIDLTRFAAEDIERIEIVRGSSSALYGTDAIGGVINIITRKAQDPVAASARASFGTLNNTDIHGNIGFADKRWSVRFTAGRHQGDGFDLTPNTVSTTASAFDTVNASYQLDWRRSSTLRFFGNGEYRISDQDGVDERATGAVFDRSNRTETILASLGTELSPSTMSQLRLTAHYTQFRDQFVLDQRESSALDQRNVTRDQLGQLTAQYTNFLFGSHLLTVGAEGFYEKLETDRVLDGSGDRQRAALYLQDEWTLFDEPMLVLVPGGRIDYDSQFGFYPTPKVTLRFDPHKSVVVRSTYGWGFRAPDFKDLFLRFENPSVGYVAFGNPDLQPETSRSANIGTEYTPSRWLWLSVNLFRNDIDNLITSFTQNDATPTSPTVFSFDNIESATTQGVEAAARLRITSGLRFDLGYTLTDSEDQESSLRLAGRALHRGTASLRFRNQAWGFDGVVRSSIVGPRPFYQFLDNGQVLTTESDPYATLDVRLSQNVSIGERKLGPFVGAENLLDAGDARFTPLQPRTFYAGIRGEL